MPNPIANVRFSITITVAGLLTVASTVTALLYICIPAVRDELEFCAAIVGGAAVVYSGFYAGLSLRTSIERSRKDKSFRILNELNRADLTTIRLLIEKELLVNKDAMSKEAVYNQIVSDQDILRAVTTILGLYEDSALAIQEDYVDEKILYKSLCFQVPWIFDGLSPYIGQEQELTHAKLYCETEKLVSKWKAGKLLSTGEDAPILTSVLQDA